MSRGENVKCCVIYDDVFLKHRTGAYHPERPQRLIDIMDALKSKGILKSVALEKPWKASVSDVVMVHEERYVDLVRRAVERKARYIDPDTPISEESFDVALYAVGAVKKGCHMLFKEGYDCCFTIQRPPGHHAGVSGPALGAPTLGFCLFNNVAIAAKMLIKEYGCSKVAIFDFDCHHGNGTQEIFYQDNSVLYISTHQDGRTCYPGTGFISEVGEGDGEGYNINIPLPPLSGDDVYLEALNKVVKPILEEFSPKVLLLSAGFDAHKDDPITSMKLSLNTYINIAEMIAELKSKGVIDKFMLVLEGGYGPGLPRGVYDIIASLVGYELERENWSVSTSNVKSKGLSVVERVLEEVVKPYWKIK